MVTAWLVFLAFAAVVVWVFRRYVVHRRVGRLSRDPSDVPFRPSLSRPTLDHHKTASNPGPTRDGWRE